MCTIDDPAGVYSERTLKARKEVHGMQPSDYAGEKYSYVFAIWEGSPSECHTCEHCMVGQRWLLKNCSGFMHHGLMEEIQEHADDYHEIRFGMLRLKAGMRRKWKRFAGEGLMPIQPMPMDIHV